MSLYNMLFGFNQMAPTLLKVLNFSTFDIPRFRDCFLKDGKIVIYTRTGGGNRDYYESKDSCEENYPEYFVHGSDHEETPCGPWNSDLRASPYYISDEDDDFDATYAYFYFSIPDEFKEDLKSLEENNENHFPSEKWKALLESMNTNK